MELYLRNETEADFREVETLTREAFWNLYFPGCDEHFLIHSLRSHPDFLKDLDFVALHDGKIIGHIAYTRSWLTDETGRETEIVTFGPLCVHPKFQRQGVGSALIQHTKAMVQGKGIIAMVILGDPHNYCKHGFKSARDLNISDMNGEFPAGMLALALNPDALAGHQWKFRYTDAYTLNPEEVAAFDAGFPYKEKCYQPSQEIFSIAVRSYLK